MRQVPLALRPAALLALLALLTFTAPAQESLAPPEISRRSSGNSQAAPSGDRKTGVIFAALLARSRARRPGLQKLLSGATGLTQVTEVPLSGSRGLISSNGQPGTSNFFNVDGFAANLGVEADETSLIRGAGSLPTLTAYGSLSILSSGSSVQEIAIKTMSSAKEQRVAGANLDFTSRSGNNRFSGSVFETFGNSRLNANDPFAQARGLARPESRLNNFGGGLGGYINQDDAWFYVSYDGLRAKQPSFALTEVPDESTRNGAVSAIRPILDAFPVVNGRATEGGFGEAAASFVNPATHDIFGFRVDVQPSSDSRISTRYSVADSDAEVRADRGFSLNTQRRFDNLSEMLGISGSFLPNSNMIISGRAGLARNRIRQRFVSDEFGGARMLPALPFDFLKFDFGKRGGAVADGNSIQTTLGQFQAAGAFDWIFNVNQLTIGAEYRRISLNSGASATERGVLFESAVAASNGFASRIVEISRIPGSVPTSQNASFFGQMTTRVGSRLRFDYGARLDMDFAPLTSSTSIGSADSVPQMRDRRSNFAPRFGFAFDVTGRGKAIIRGGAGLYFDLGNSAAAEVFTSSEPYTSVRFSRNDAFDSAPANPLTTSLLFNRALRTPRTWHVFAEYQQELFGRFAITATYTESFGRQLYSTQTRVDIVSPVRYNRITNNDGESRHRSLQLRLERRFSRGFSFVSRYSLAKTTDNISADTLRESNDSAVVNGPSNLDLRQQFNLGASYDLPQFFDSGIAEKLFEDWSFAANVNARTGFPIDVGTLRVNDFGTGFVRAVRVGGVPAYLDESSTRRLNPAAFSVSPITATDGRNSVRGFGFFQLDTTVRRRVRFTNEIGLDISLNAYNLLNNTNYSDVSGILGTQFESGTFRPNAYFGQSMGAYGGSGFTPLNLYGGARNLTVGVKFVF